MIFLIFIFLYIFIYMSRKYTKDKEVRLNMLLSKDLKKRYQMFCLENDYNMSERIRGFMEKELEENKNK